MVYIRPANAIPLSAAEKRELLSHYCDFYRELACINPGELNKKLPRSALAASLDRIGALIVEEAKALAAGSPHVRQFFDENGLPGKMSTLLPDDFRVFCLLLNGPKQWLSAEQAATDRYLLGGTARTQCREMVSRCLVAGEVFSGEIELHHPVRDGRPPLPLSKEGHRIIEQQTASGDPSEREAPDEIERMIGAIKKPNESWSMLRRGCRMILGLPPGGGTPASNSNAKALARRAIGEDEAAPAGASAVDGHETAWALKSRQQTCPRKSLPAVRLGQNQREVGSRVAAKGDAAHLEPRAAEPI